MSDLNFKTSAIRYANRKLYVFPLRPKDKRPLIKDWENKATIDMETIDNWWNEHPKANIGIACGPSELVVIDIDEERVIATPKVKKIYKLCDTNPTWEMLTGTGGTHFYYRLPEGLTLHNTAGFLAPSVDTRSTGGYVVAPPSIHPVTKTEYKWIRGMGAYRGREEPNLSEPPRSILTKLATKHYEPVDFSGFSDAQFHYKPFKRGIVYPRTLYELLEKLPKTNHAIFDEKMVCPAARDALENWKEVISLIMNKRISWYTIIAMLEVAPEGRRSSWDFHLCCKLAEENWTVEEAVALFAVMPIGFAGKFRESGVRYLVRTYRNASKQVSK